MTLNLITHSRMRVFKIGVVLEEPRVQDLISLHWRSGSKLSFQILQPRTQLKMDKFQHR